MGDRASRRVFAPLGLLFLISALASVLSACGATTSVLQPTVTAPTLIPTIAALPVDCPHADQPTIGSGAHLAVTPNSGPVGTQLKIEASGLQSGCHLTINLYITPPTQETNGTALSAPLGGGDPILWQTVSASGALSAIVCACQTIWTSNDGKLYSPTPVPNTTHTSAYAPHVGDYIFFTVAGPNTPDPPKLFARFTFTS